jgi:hypothetical protein
VEDGVQKPRVLAQSWSTHMATRGLAQDPWVEDWIPENITGHPSFYCCTPHPVVRACTPVRALLAEPPEEHDSRRRGPCTCGSPRRTQKQDAEQGSCLPSCQSVNFAVSF